MQFTRYPVYNHQLKAFIKYFWVLQSDRPVNIQNKLLPVCNMDLILNLSRPITYINGEKESSVTGFHINGQRQTCCEIRQNGTLAVLGISFSDFGAYPFLKTPLDCFAGQTIELSDILRGFNLKTNEIAWAACDFKKVFERVEKEMLKMMDTRLIPSNNTSKLLNCFSTEINQMNINVFCERYGIHPRTLERVVKRYNGLSPKNYQRIGRFHMVLKDSYINKKLTDIAYENNYYDQSHFIKDFKDFTGSTPAEFLKSKKAILQMINH